MKPFLREIRPLLIYLLIGVVFTVFMALATGKREPTGRGPGYWDEQDQMNHALDLMYSDSLPQ